MLISIEDYTITLTLTDETLQEMQDEAKEKDMQLEDYIEGVINVGRGI